MSKIIAVANQKGGSGKTTTAINLIHHLKPDTVMDADEHRGISKVLAISNSYDTKVIAPSNEREVREALKAFDADLMIIDCGGFDTPTNRLIMAYADMIITPSCDDATEQFGLASFSESLDSVSSMVGRDIVANVLPNRIHHARSADSIKLPKRDNLNVLPFVIPHSAAISNAALQGKGVASGTVAFKYSQLTKYITEQLEA